MGVLFPGLNPPTHTSIFGKPPTHNPPPYRERSTHPPNQIPLPPPSISNHPTGQTVFSEAVGPCTPEEGEQFQEEVVWDGGEGAGGGGQLLREEWHGTHHCGGGGGEGRASERAQGGTVEKEDLW